VCFDADGANKVYPLKAEESFIKIPTVCCAWQKKAIKQKQRIYKYLVI